MRGAGAITGLLVLGAFVIPSAYSPKREPVSRDASTAGGRVLTAAEHETGTAALAGRIYDPNGRPLAAATVSLAGSGFWPPRSVRTGPDGRFHWPGIPAGIYELRASKGPLVAPALEGLILEAGATRTFAFQLERGWILSGQVTDARSGAAVARAEVTVAPRLLGLHTRKVETDARGRFGVTGIVAEETSLYVEADGYVTAGPLRHRADEGLVAVRLERASVIEGRVIDVGGRPIQGAVVRAFGEGHVRAAPPYGGDSLGVTSGPVPPISAAATGALAFVRQATTDRSGAFVLGGLRSGAYTLGVSHNDYGPAESERLQLRGGATRSDVRIVLPPGAELAGRVVDERGFGLEAIPVEVRTRHERLPRISVTASDGSFSFRGVRGEVEVTALPYDLPASRELLTIEDDALVTVELTLETTLHTLRGRVVDERGFGVEGALLTVSSTDPSRPVRRRTKTEVDGTFAVPALPDPPFDLTAEHPAFSSARLTRIEGTDDVEVVMSSGVRLLGRIFDDWTGKSLRNAHIRLEGATNQSAKTRADGTFSFRRLPTGTYDISFSHADYETQTRRIVLERPRYVDRPQELEPVRLQPGGVVEGEVVDAYSQPVAGAEVAWGEPPQWERGARTRSRGTFQLRGVPSGEVWITARHPVAGEGSSSDSITVKPLEVSPGAFVQLPKSLLE